MSRLRKAISTLIAVFAVTYVAMINLATIAGAAEHVIAGNFTGQSIDLLKQLQAVDSDSKIVAIDVPTDTTGQKVRMTLSAKGPQAPYRWVIFSLNNPSGIQREFVLVVPKQGFERSRVLWPSAPSKKNYHHVGQHRHATNGAEDQA